MSSIAKFPRMSAITHWLTEPAVPLPPIPHRQARLLMLILLSIISSAILSEILYVWTTHRLSGMAEIVGIVISLIATYILSRYGYLKTAVALTIFIPALGMFVMIVNDPGQNINLLPFMVIPLLISSVFFSIRDIGKTAILFSLGILSLLIVAPSIKLSNLLVGPLVFLWIITGTIQIASRHRDAVEMEHQIELARSETRFRQMAENIHEVFWTYEISNGKITYVSPAYEKVIGQTRESFYTSPFSILQIVHPEDHLQAQDAIKKVGHGKSISIEARITHPDGSVRWIWSRGFPVFDCQGTVLSMAGIMTDITDRKQVQQTLEEMNQTLEQRVQERTEELISANASLDKAARMKDEFLASMSHELRTPLTGILGLSEALQLNIYGMLNEKQNKALGTIEESGRHLLELLNDVLDLSKIEAGKLELQFDICSLADICQASLQMIKGMAGHKRQMVHYSPPAESATLYADARRLKQVLVNLLSNAVKFTPENGELGLEVQADQDNRKIKLTVWDKGIGIKSVDLHKLFQPFTQIDSRLSREYSGTGLGLSLVYRLIEAHNGGIEVESVHGEGSRFTVILPWNESSHPIHDDPRKHFNLQTGITASPDKAQSPLILITDDNEVLLQMVTDFLEAQQYRVVQARNGFELLEKIMGSTPDLILLDIQMPRMDGLEAIRRIRSHANPEIAMTPLVAITALAMPGDRERCLQAGANEYMSKPVQLVELAATIQKLIGKK
jgi:PAS domain S-box-containing protein